MTTSTSLFRIGKAAKITGISPDTLRVWERRYGAVVPTRTEAGGRLYNSSDIARLKLMKTLIDSGDAIGSIANLSQQELEQRVERHSINRGVTPSGPNLTLISIGQAVSVKLKSLQESQKGFQLVSSFPNMQALRAEVKPLKADILVIEQATLQQDAAQHVIELINMVNAAHAVIVYRFSARDALDLLPEAKCSTLHAPIEARTLIQHCLSLVDRKLVQSREDNDQPITSHAPPRRYDDDSLAKIAAISPTIKCECPHHLAELLSSLAAFEQYSSECENRNQQDAELHAYLSKTASHARHMIEGALEMVIEIENIEL